MRAYVVTSGSVFALVVVAHVLRAVEEGISRAADPWFLLSTAISLALAVWAGRTFKQVAQAPPRTP